MCSIPPACCLKHCHQRRRTSISSSLPIPFTEHQDASLEGQCEQYTFAEYIQVHEPESRKIYGDNMLGNTNAGRVSILSYQVWK